MKHTFFKYQGTGNDFVMIDNRQDNFDKTKTEIIAHLCDRRLGIGADGLILLENDNLVDFKMVYFNADGNESSMCGNGGRCITHFANFLGIIQTEATFMAIDGPHLTKIIGDKIHLQMQDVSKIENSENFIFLNTGSPHHIEIFNNIDDINVKEEGSRIRYSDLYKGEGANINFVEQIDTGNFKVRTYERGVEDETLSCGTGVTAVALAMNYLGKTKKKILNINTHGGDLSVSFNVNKDLYHDIWLIGAATKVYKGEIEW